MTKLVINAAQIDLLTNDGALNVLYTGKVTDNVYYELKDVFPDGFWNQHHQNRVHGASQDGNQQIEVWGVYKRNVFVKTLSGNLFFSKTISSSYNSCINLKDFESNCSKSPWVMHIRAILNFINSSIPRVCRLYPVTPPRFQASLMYFNYQIRFYNYINRRK